jgi:hypothetical protein
MKRQLPGLYEAAGESRIAIPDGVYLVRVDSTQYRWHAQKPFYGLRLSILEPKVFTGHCIVSRLYCTSKAMWRLGWFLGDFIYDRELLSQNQVDERLGWGCQDRPHRPSQHSPGESRRLRPCQPVGSTVHLRPHSASNPRHCLQKEGLSR